MNFNLGFFDTVVFLFLTVFTLIYTIVLCKKYEKKSFIDYLLFGRRLTLPLFVTTLVSTWYGDIFGITQIAAKNGLYAIAVYGIGFYLAALVFMLFFVEKAMDINGFSLPDIIKKIYGKFASKIASLMIITSALPITYAIGIALLLQQLFGWDFDVAMFLGLVFVIAYIGVRGFSGIVYSDAIQFVLMFLSVVMVLVFSFMKYGGANYLTANLDASYFSIQGRNNSMLDLLIWFFIAVVTTFMSPVFYQRCFAAKSTRVAKMGISISVVFWMIFDFCTVVGSMYAKASQPDTPLHEVYFNYAINVLPIGLKGVFIAGIAATILSTLDSFLFICVTTLIYDIGGKRFVKSQKFKIASLLFIGSITFFIASKFKSDIVLLYGFFARYCRVTLAIPLMLTILLGKKIDEKQFVWSIVIAILSMIVNDLIIHESKVKSFYVGAMASFSVFFIFMCVNFFLKKMLKK